MFRFVVYKNSVLATICSFFGSAFIAMSIFSMFSRELGILEGIGMIAAGLGLMWLGHVISDRKERKKQAKAANAAQNTSFNSNTYTQPNKATANTANVVNDSVMHKKPVKISPVLAAIFFLLAALFGLWSCERYNYSVPLAFVRTGWCHVVECAACILLMIECFRIRKIQKVSLLHVFGFLGLIAGSAVVALRFVWFTSGGGGRPVLNVVPYIPLFKIAVFLLMLLCVIFAREKTRGRLGGIVRRLWFIPVLGLALVTAKIVDNNRSIFIVKELIRDGLYWPRGEVMESISHVFLLAAMIFNGFILRAICKKPAVSFRQTSYVQPEVQYTAPVQPVQEKTVQPQEKVQYTVPEEPKTEASQVNDQEVEKKLQAYKDLLDCGILTPEEYEQKLRELRRG